VSQEELEAWLEASKADEDAANTLMAARNYSLVAFHAQQAVKKYLKALVAYSGKPKFNHSLIDLSNTLAEINNFLVPPAIRQDLVNLEFHYAASRYPGHTRISHLYNEQKAEEAIECMQRVLQYLESLPLT
jgi:HEPN domain-containing protein